MRVAPGFRRSLSYGTLETKGYRAVARRRRAVLMRVLIIGGTRFLGYHVVGRLLSDGHEVTLFHRGEHRARFARPIWEIHGDRRRLDTFPRRFRGRRFDAVIDFCAFDGDDAKSAVMAFAGCVGRYVLISTGAVYLVREGASRPYVEDSFDGPEIARPAEDPGEWSYGIHKRRCEEVVWRAHESGRFPVTVFRPSVVIGERDPTLRAQSYWIRMLDGGGILVPGGVQKEIRPVYQGDVVEWIVRSLDLEVSKGRAYNLSMETSITLAEFLQHSAEVLEAPASVHSVSMDQMEARGIGREISPFSSRWVSIVDSSRASHELRHAPTSWRRWLERVIRWQLDHEADARPDNYRYRPLERRWIEDLLARDQSEE